MAKKKMTMDAVLLTVDRTDGKKQRRLLTKRKRGGVVLTREQVKAIKSGRKLLRKELKGRGAKGKEGKEDFNLIASSMGLYYDKGRFPLLLGWLFHGRRGLLALLGAAALGLLTLFLYSTITQMRGHFTINMSDGMFREGFTLSETEDFANPTTHLFCEPAVDVPCISINHIPEDIDDHEGQHNADYFAYTFFIRNEGESTVDYDWAMNLNSESLDLSKAAWVMIFEDGEMLFYAEPNADGEVEALPAFDDNSRGYLNLPLIGQNADAEGQYQVITERENMTYHRVIPKSFVSEDRVATGTQIEVAPMEVHKYTVVIWLEGDDPDCTNDMIGGHVGMDITMKLVSEEDELEGGKKWQARWNAFWENLKFWED